MVTDQCGRLIAYTCEELSAYSWEEVNSLPYGISRVFAGAQNATKAREESITLSRDAVERVDIVAYSALQTAIERLEGAVDDLFTSLD